MTRVGIVYNDPIPGKLSDLGESGAVLSVLESVSNVKKALETLGYEVQTLPLRSPMSLAETELAKLKVDMLFNLFEGFDDIPGSEATIAQAMEKLHLCVTGSPSRALRLAQNKAEEKDFLRLNNIPSPNWQLLSPETVDEFKLNFPSIVKPVEEHASHGISEDSVVKTTESLRQRVEFIYSSYLCPSLVEEFISGREFSVLVMGNEDPRVFPIEEIIYTLPPCKPHILTYAAKWVPGDEYFIHTQDKCPAELTPELLKQAAAIATRAFKVFGCRGYARVDMRQTESGELLVLEVNPNPDVSSEGGARLQAEAAGMDYVTFIREIVALAQAA